MYTRNTSINISLKLIRFQSLVFSLMFIAFIRPATAQDFHWVQSVGWSDNDVGGRVITDMDGNIYSAGYFTGYADFDPGLDTLELTSNGLGDIYLMKSDSSGNLIWVKHFGGSYRSYSSGIRLDNSGNIFITGSFKDTVDFDPGPGVFLMNSSGDDNMFVMKLDNSGILQWAKSVQGTGIIRPSFMDMDFQGNLLIAGVCTDTVDFDPGPAFSWYYGSTLYSGFIVKLDSLGGLGWAYSSFGMVVNDIKTNQTGDFYLAGQFGDTVDFDFGAGVYTMVGTGTNSFICRYDQNAGFIWARSYSGDNDCRSITIQENSAVVATGGYWGPSDFDPGSGTLILPVGPFQKTYITKLDSAGNLVWAKSVGGTGFTESSRIVSGTFGDLYLTGNFSGTTDFDPGPDSVQLTAGFSFGADVFLCKLRYNGSFAWARNMGGYGTDYGLDLGLDPFNNLIVTGGFRNTAEFGNAGAGTVNSHGEVDIFLARYRPCLYSAGVILNVSACTSYTSTSGHSTWTSSGTYLDTISGTLGCDEIITINLTITSLNEIMAQGPTTFCQGDSVILSANPNLTAYQWYNYNYAIPGANNMNFTAKSRGRYKCISQNSGLCSDTSNTIIVKVPCISIGQDHERNSFISESETHGIFIFPNPGTGIFTIDSPSGQLCVFNQIGQLIYSTELFDGEKFLDISEFPDGIYLVKLMTEEESYSSKLLLSR